MAKTTKKNTVRVEAEGQAHIQASFNNIIISLTNKSGQVIRQLYRQGGSLFFSRPFKVNLGF